MAYNLRLIDAADSDIREAIKYYEQVLLGLSLDFERCLEEAYSNILTMPLGYEVRFNDIRITYIRRFPFAIHYVVDGNDITVIAVFHQAISPIKWLERKSKLG